MICPKCEYEYSDRIAVCPECGVKLIPLDEFEGKLVRPSDYMVIYTTDKIYEAEMLQTNLKSAGIDVKVLSQKDQNFPTYGDLSVIKILVNKNDAEDALMIIDDINKNSGD